MPEIDINKSTVIKLAKPERRMCQVCRDLRTLEFYDMDFNSMPVCTPCMAHLDSAQKVLQKVGLTPPSRMVKTNNIKRFQ